MKEVWRCRLRKKWAYQTSVACCSSPPGGMGCEATSATHITLQNLKLNCAGLRHILDEDEEHVLLKKRTTSEVLLWFCYLPRHLDLQDRAILRIHLAKLRAMVLWLNWWASRTWIQLWRHEDIFSVWKNPRPPCSLVQAPCLLSQFKKMFWAAVQCAEPGSSPVLCCAPLPLTVYVKPSIKVGYLHYIFFSDGNVVKCSNADFINLV